MFGQSSPIDPTVGFTDQIKDIDARVAELERRAGSGRTQYGEESGTTDGSGELTVTFPTAFASTPVVVATARTSLDRFVVLRSVSTTGFTVAYYDLSAAGTATSASIIVDWVAFG